MGQHAAVADEEVIHLSSQVSIHNVPDGGGGAVVAAVNRGRLDNGFGLGPSAEENLPGQSGAFVEFLPVARRHALGDGSVGENSAHGFVTDLDENTEPLFLRKSSAFSPQ